MACRFSFGPTTISLGVVLSHRRQLDSHTQYCAIIHPPMQTSSTQCQLSAGDGGICAFVILCTKCRHILSCTNWVRIDRLRCFPCANNYIRTRPTLFRLGGFSERIMAEVKYSNEKQLRNIIRCVCASNRWEMHAYDTDWAKHTRVKIYRYTLERCSLDYLETGEAGDSFTTIARQARIRFIRNWELTRIKWKVFYCVSYGCENVFTRYPKKSHNTQLHVDGIIKKRIIMKPDETVLIDLSETRIAVGIVRANIKEV